MSSERNDQLLREATEAAREGNRGGARKLVKQVLNSDDTNVRAWMLLYRVSEDTGEKRQALERILEIDPANARAQEALEKLDVRIQRHTDDEVAPGINRGQLLRIGTLLGLLVLLILGAAFLIITISNDGNADRFAEETAAAMFATEVVETRTAISALQTQNFIDATATFFALNSPTPTPSNTRQGPPTLPDPFTPTFTPQAQVSPTALPPPAEASGQVIAYGGPDLLNDGYFPLYSFNAAGGEPRVIVDEVERRGRYPSGVQQTRIVYTLWSRQTFEYFLASIDMSTGETTFLSELWANSPLALGANFILETDQPNVSLDNNRVVFVASTSNNRIQPFMLDYNAVGGDPLRRLVTDDFDYSFPAISPDNSRVIAVRTESSGNVDLFEIGIDTGTLRPITTDGTAMLETMPRYHPAENEIAYVGKTTPTGNNDIYIRPADGGGQALNITNTENADELHPVYSPDGRYIAFASNRTGVYHIYVYDRTNGDLFQISDGPDDYFPGTWIR